MNEIRTKKELIALAKTLGVRDDWHEPDEAGVTAKVTGGKFDNAGFDDEKFVIIKQNAGYTNDPDGIEVKINLATLLAIASGYYDGSLPLDRA